MGSHGGEHRPRAGPGTFAGSKAQPQSPLYPLPARERSPLRASMPVLPRHTASLSGKGKGLKEGALGNPGPEPKGTGTCPLLKGAGHPSTEGSRLCGLLRPLLVGTVGQQIKGSSREGQMPVSQLGSHFGFQPRQVLPCQLPSTWKAAHAAGTGSSAHSPAQRQAHRPSGRHRSTKGRARCGAGPPANRVSFPGRGRCPEGKKGDRAHVNGRGRFNGAAWSSCTS